MFPFDRNILDTDLPLISKDFTILLYDDEPILYVGKNKYGNYIIGSSIDENIEDKVEWHFHTIVDFDNYQNFMNKRKSYFDILRNSKSIFIIEKTFDNSSIKVFPIAFSDIPEDYLPLEDSLCPDLDDFLFRDISYSFHLVGNEADQNHLNPESFENIIKNFPKIIEKPKKIITGYLPNLKGKPYVAASYGGSFIINFDYQLDMTNVELPLLEPLLRYADNVKRLFNKYVDYCFKVFPDELDEILSGKSSKEYEKLLGEFRSFIKDILSLESEDLPERFADETLKVPEIISHLTDDLGTKFDSMELTSGIFPIATINTEDKMNYDKMTKIIESERVTVDSQASEYKIHIYQLNVDTRKGWAYVKRNDDPDAMLKANINIQGDEPLETTKYTLSLHENRFIQVRAIGKKEKNILKSLDIIFEEQ